MNYFLFIGFGIFSKDSENEIKLDNFDLISDEKQDASTVVKSLRLLREQDWFKGIEKKKIHYLV